MRVDLGWCYIRRTYGGFNLPHLIVPKFLKAEVVEAGGTFGRASGNEDACDPGEVGSLGSLGFKNVVAPSIVM